MSRSMAVPSCMPVAIRSWPRGMHEAVALELSQRIARLRPVA